jgi:hypothetical protein
LGVEIPCAQIGDFLAKESVRKPIRASLRQR